MDDILIGIALPDTNSHFRKEFVDSFFCMARPVQYAYLRPQTSGPIDGVRNELVQRALMHNCTHIFWCDTDQKIPADTMLKLINHEQPIVCAKVHRRKPPYDPLLKRVNPDGESEMVYLDIPSEEWSGKELIEVDATGFGCCLIDIKVMQDMEKPWFKMDIHSKPVIGEDIYFWRKVKVLGYKIFVDCSINIGHLGTASVDEKTYFAYKYSQDVG